MRKRLWIVILGVALGLLARMLFPPELSEASPAETPAAAAEP